MCPIDFRWMGGAIHYYPERYDSRIFFGYMAAFLSVQTYLYYKLEMYLQKYVVCLSYIHQFTLDTLTNIEIRRNIC